MAEYYRRITLTPKEFLLALDSQRRVAPEFLPTGEILEYKIMPDGEISISVRMVHGKNVNEVSISYRFLDVLPVLLKFCSENNIELPETGKRYVKSDKGVLSLVLVTEI